MQEIKATFRSVCFARELAHDTRANNRIEGTNSNLTIRSGVFLFHRVLSNKIGNSQIWLLHSFACGITATKVFSKTIDCIAARLCYQITSETCKCGSYTLLPAASLLQKFFPKRWIASPVAFVVWHAPLNVVTTSPCARNHH